MKRNCSENKKKGPKSTKKVIDCSNRNVVVIVVVVVVVDIVVVVVAVIVKTFIFVW